MDARVEKLIKAFESNGWKMAGSADISREWWFEDIIQLTFLWRPVGEKIYLTLLIDPMDTNWKEVWAIGISPGIPGDKHHKFLDQITLNDIKRTDLTAFVESINERLPAAKE